MHGETVGQALSRITHGAAMSQSLPWRGVVRATAIKEEGVYGTKN